MRRVPVAVVLALLLAGCGTADDRTRTRAAVERFYDAIGENRAEIACEQLSTPARDQLESQSGRACAAAITELDYEGGAVVGVQVFITNAKADLRGGESAFLTLERGRWRLSAVACRAAQGPPRETPTDCEVAA